MSGVDAGHWRQSGGVEKARRFARWRHTHAWWRIRRRKLFLSYLYSVLTLEVRHLVCLLEIFTVFCHDQLVDVTCVHTPHFRDNFYTWKYWVQHLWYCTPTPLSHLKTLLISFSFWLLPIAFWNTNLSFKKFKKILLTGAALIKVGTDDGNHPWHRKIVYSSKTN